jgi:AcrR family transcriptional regulator
MARALSAEKRELIKHQATRLFARNGFAATSVADIASVCDLPVGSIYTYFGNKEEIVRAIVEEGWAELRNRLRAELLLLSTPEEKLRLLIEGFFPVLLEDVDFITILLSEGISYTRIEEKIDEIVGLLHDVLAGARDRPGFPTDLSRRDLEAALLVYFLGVMDAVRLSRVSSLSITTKDVLGVLRLTIRNALGIDV